MDTDNLTSRERVMLPLMRIHDLVYRKSKGRLGHRIPGRAPSLLLHTTGAKTSRQRTIALTYAQSTDSYVVVASNGGSGRYPGWYHNLRARPKAEVNIGTKRFGVTAREITPYDAAYSSLWELVNKNNANHYAGYQVRTSRPISIFVLTPSRV